MNDTVMGLLIVEMTIVVRIGIKIVKSMDFAILISLNDLDFE
jgi:hypothetical protein